MKFDLAIIGAGPAGMSAAKAAHDLGLKAVLIDEQAQPGGQIYRQVEAPSLQDKGILGPDYYAGKQLVDGFRNSDCHYIQAATVWQIEADGNVYYSCRGEASSLQANHILIASGAQERPFPIAGWTLPGVMTAGAAQVMLKQSALAAEGAVFAGNGPLLYLIAWQYLRAGVEVKAILDTNPTSNWLPALKQLWGGFRGRQYVAKGLQLLGDIQSAGVSHIKGVTKLEAIGDDDKGISQVRYLAKGKVVSIDTKHLFLHQGVVPNVNLAMASGCQHEWHEGQLCWAPVKDAWGQSSQQHISIAGDVAGIGGAVAAQLQGFLAVQQIAHKLDCQTVSARDQNSKTARKQLRKELAFRPFLEQLYRPADAFRKPQADDVVVCRCEEITLAEIKTVATTQGCLGPNQMKAFTRCGMGSCQGRQCGLTVSELMADYTNQSVADCGYYRLRAPVKPLNLDELAQLHQPH